MPWEIGSETKASLSVGTRFLYFSLGMRAGGGCAVKSTFGAIVISVRWAGWGLAVSLCQAYMRLIGRLWPGRRALHVSGGRGRRAVRDLGGIRK